MSQSLYVSVAENQPARAFVTISWWVGDDSPQMTDLCRINDAGEREELLPQEVSLFLERYHKQGGPVFQSVNLWGT